MRTTFFLLLLASTSFADEAADLRAAAENQFPRELPAAIAEPRSYSWQTLAPKWLKRHLRLPLAAEVKLDPRLAGPDRGFVERQRPALEQLALGLNADPPRPEYPLLAAGARSTGDSLEAFDIYQIPPLSRTSDARLTLSGDPATVATRPYTAPLVTAGRGSAPPRYDVGVPDPFAIRREAALPVIPPDVDPPAATFETPARPVLPVEAKKP